MTCSWPTVTLDECASFQEGYVNPTQKKEHYFDGPVKWLRAVDLNNGSIRNTSRTLSEEGFKSAGKSALLFEPGTLAISKSGTIGRIGILEDYMCGNRAVINIKVDKDKCDNLYIFYVLLMSRRVIETLAVGSVQKNLYTSALGSLELRLPPLQVQAAIAKQLSDLDKKIDLNTQTNQTLEEMAQAIFKSWFVDFDPVKAKMNGEQPEGMDAATASLFPEKLVESELGLIPEGWKVDNLGNYLDVLETGKRPKGGVKGITEGIPSVGAENILGVGNYQFGKEKFIPEELFLSLKKGVIESEDVLIYKDGGKPGDFKPRFSMFGYGFPYKTFAINEHVFRIRSSKLGQPYLYCQMRDDYVYNDLRNKGAKAAIPGINQKDVKSMLIVVPNESLLSKFNDSVANIFEMILKNSLQSQELAKLRDTLLPKLLSGEIELETAKEQ